MIGGRGVKEENYDDAYAFDTRTSQWQRLAIEGSHHGRGFHCAGIVGQSLIVFGGSMLEAQTPSYFGDVLELDLSSFN